MSKDLEAQLAFDKEHLWHPYTSMVNPLPTYPVESAHGVKLRLSDGRELIDGMSSWWAAIHGYNHPDLNAALTQQMSAMSHVMFGGLTHQSAIDLGRNLLALAPNNLQKVFIADSGSVAVEVAIKMAIQYWYTTGKPDKKRLLTVKGGYHGDTAACMSVCDPDAGMHEMFTSILPKHLFAEKPQCSFNQEWSNEYLDDLKLILESQHQNIAALILEPIVQGAGGMYFYSPQYLKALRSLCDEFDVLLILDEIATGFGRTGKLFACEHAGIQPDIMCVGKALTGGYISLAATLSTEKVALGISNAGEGLLMHGPTFMANPLACAVANASLKIISNGNWKTQVANIEQHLVANLAPCKNLPYVKEVRVLGAIGVVELNAPVDMKKIMNAFVGQGIWVRPFGKLVYLMPPYVMNTEEITFLTQKFCKVLEDKRQVF